jgi:TIR domain-containing protein
MVINDLHQDADFYDVLRSEFFCIWDSQLHSYPYPGGWLERRPRVFLSYSEADRELANEIYQGFQEGGIDCYMARHNLSPGDVWPDELRKNLRSCLEFVVLLTRNSASSPWVQKEVGAAWAFNLNITPAIVQLTPAEAAHLLGDRQSVDVSTTEGKKQLITAVADRIRGKDWRPKRERIAATEI